MLAVRVPCSRARAADDEQADAEDEDDELKSDAYGVLEAALQTLVADGELWRGRAGRRPPGARRASRPVVTSDGNAAEGREDVPAGRRPSW
jgi:hypothetical protein